MIRQLGDSPTWPRAPLGRGERTLQALRAIGGCATSRQLARKLGVSVQTARRSIAALLADGSLRRRTLWSSQYAYTRQYYEPSRPPIR